MTDANLNIVGKCGRFENILLKLAYLLILILTKTFAKPPKLEKGHLTD